MAETKIEYADYSANTHRGCTKVASGCQFCYAERMAKRNPAVLGQWGPNGTRVVCKETLWRDVAKWDREAACCCASLAKDRGIQSQSELHLRGCPQCDPPRVFWNDISDTFESWDGPMVDAKGRQLFTVNGAEYFTEGDYPECRPLTMQDVRNRIFRTVDEYRNMTHLFVTKRPENALKMAFDAWCEKVPHVSQNAGDGWRWRERENVWLIYSASDQATLESGLPHLLACRDLVPVLGLSLEPLTGPVNLNCIPRRWEHPSGDPTLWHMYYDSCLDGFRAHGQGGWTDEKFRVDWVIVGCEQLTDHKPGRFADKYAKAAESIIRQCLAAGVPVFHKQMPINGKVSGNPEEWPEGILRTRQYPNLNRR
jgi:protein gp37